MVHTLIFVVFLTFNLVEVKKSRSLYLSSEIFLHLVESWSLSILLVNISLGYNTHNHFLWLFLFLPSKFSITPTRRVLACSPLCAQTEETLLKLLRKLVSAIFTYIMYMVVTICSSNYTVLLAFLNISHHTPPPGSLYFVRALYH